MGYCDGFHVPNHRDSSHHCRVQHGCHGQKTLLDSWLSAVCSRHALVHKRQLQHAAACLLLLRLGQPAAAKQLPSFDGRFSPKKHKRNRHGMPAILHVHNASSSSDSSRRTLRVCFASTAIPSCWRHLQFLFPSLCFGEFMSQASKKHEFMWLTAFIQFGSN